MGKLNEDLEKLDMYAEMSLVKCVNLSDNEIVDIARIAQRVIWLLQGTPPHNYGVTDDDDFNRLKSLHIGITEIITNYMRHNP